MVWLQQRDKKESSRCECCKVYVMGGQFYWWHSHPALPQKHFEPMLICSKCAKREAGVKGFKKLKEEKFI